MTFDRVRRTAWSVLAFPLDGPFPVNSVWAVVDLATGATAAGAPTEVPFRERTLPDGAIRDERLGQADRVAVPEARVRILLARPGVGAWVAEAADGTPSDADGSGDGTVEIALSQLEVLGSSPPPPAFLEPRDVLVAVNPESLEIYVTTYEGAR